MRETQAAECVIVRCTRHRGWVYGLGHDNAIFYYY